MTAMRLHRYLSPSGGFALGKMGVGATMLKQGKTAKDYVQNGLIAMWDGIENAGWGTHDASATEWADLISNSAVACNLPMRGHTILDTAVVCNNTLPMVKRPANPSGMITLMQSGWTVEVCAQIPAADANGGASWQGGIFGLCSNYLYLHPLYNATYGNSYFRVNISRPSGSGTGTSISNNIVLYDERSGQSTRNIAGKTFTVAISCDITNQSTSIYLNGEQVYTVSKGCLFAADATYYPACGINSEGRVSDTFGAGLGLGTKYHAARIGSRAFTASEIAANYAIDKERFNLP